jgi:hypothetical protein
MAKFAFAVKPSLDGNVDHREFAPDPALFRHWTEQLRDLTGCLYGRRVYEVMRYWDEDRPEWTPEERDFATAWRSRPQWVVSRPVQSVGLTPRLFRMTSQRRYGGSRRGSTGRSMFPDRALAQSLADLSLIDEYRLYVHLVVLGRGKPFFADPRPPLRLAAPPCRSALWPAIEAARPRSA